MDLISYSALALSTYTYQYGSGGLDTIFCAGCVLLGSKHVGIVNSILSAVSMLARYLAMGWLSPIQVLLTLPLEAYAKSKPTKFSVVTIGAFICAALIMANTGYVFMAIAIASSMHSEKDIGGGLILIAIGIASWATNALTFQGNLLLNFVSITAGTFVGQINFATISWTYPLAMTAMSFVAVNTHSFSIRDLGVIPLYFAFSRPYNFITDIIAEKESRDIFYFLLLNLSFMVVQMLYGIWTNSLGLISDSIHMLFDCLALAVGLVAAVMSKWPASRHHPFGFAKVEIISGFANSIFLVLISISIMIEAIERLLEPPDMTTDQLLLISTLGLGVNLVGIFAFNHGHHHHHEPAEPLPTIHSPVARRLSVVDINISRPGSPLKHNHDHFDHHDHSQTPLSKHNHNHGHSHGHEHGHDHDHALQKHLHNHHHHDHHHHGHKHDHKHDHSHNMEGIFLHILADTLGSAGVIVSTLLIRMSGWTGFDPLASIFIAVLIFLSVVPLLKSSFSDLLITLADQQEYTVRSVLGDISLMRGVGDIPFVRFWNDGNGALHGIVTIRASLDGDLEHVRSTVKNRLLDIEDLHDVVVQVDRESTHS